MSMKKVNNFQIAKVQPRCCLVSAYFFASFSLAVLIKVLLIKKSVYIGVQNFVRLPETWCTKQIYWRIFVRCLHGFSDLLSLSLYIYIYIYKYI